MINLVKVGTETSFYYELSEDEEQLMFLNIEDLKELKTKLDKLLKETK